MAVGQNSNRGSFDDTGFSHKAPTLASDMRCYFECKEVFKKDFEIRLHLKLKHRSEDVNELRKAYQAAEEEIALTRRSASTFQCAMCPKTMHENGPFHKHILKTHKMEWMDYKERYGRCEVESAPFECKICGRIVKYDRHTIHGHLKNVHGITWMDYLNRIRKMRVGETPDELPSIEFFECQVCGVSIKDLKYHVWNVHRLNELEYEKRISQMSLGQTPDPLPSIETITCQVCNVTVKEFKDHLRRSHKITEAEYKELFQE